MGARPGPTTRTSAIAYDRGGSSAGEDLLATEEPLEIRIATGGRSLPVAVTMRTPGADFELAAGFLSSEGVIAEARDIRRISYCVENADEQQRFDVVTVELARHVRVDLAPLERHFSLTSACGVCGKASLDALPRAGSRPLPPGPEIPFSTLCGLPDRLGAAQRVFAATGGLHASGLFDSAGQLVAAREDVGRHNAIDKLVGWALLEGRLPLGDGAVLVSGRSSFELVQKALVAGVPMLCSVSAPSSLAVELAREAGLTLVGFLREGRCKVYSGAERVLPG